MENYNRQRLIEYLLQAGYSCDESYFDDLMDLQVDVYSNLGIEVRFTSKVNT